MPRSTSPSREEVQLSAASTTIWKCFIGILFVCAITGSMSAGGIVVILIFTCAAVSLLVENGIAMSDLKRKHDEEDSITVESEDQDRKRVQKANTPETSIGDHELPDGDEEEEEKEMGGDGEQEEMSDHGGKEEMGDAEEKEEMGDAEEKEEMGDEDEKDEEPADDELWPFRSLLKTIKLDCLPGLASATRQGLENGESKIDCVVQEKPLHGSFNILWVIEFTDGVKWLLKVPEAATVEEFDQVAAHRLESEVKITRLIKRSTTIPLPTIYGYETTFDNVINSPFIMMEMLEGQELYDTWFDDSVSETELEERRARTLRDVAKYMSEMSQFRFHQGGSLLFGEDGEPCGVGPITFTVVPSYEVCEVGPFSDPNAYTTRKMDVGDDNELAPLTKKMSTLARLFLSWLPQGNDPKFVLKHPDLDKQNILVAPNGSVTGIIDWDKIRAEPRYNGNEAFPLWLMSDSNSAPSYGTRDVQAGGRVNTKEELIHYRDMYVAFMEEYSSRAEDTSPDAVNMTKVSLVGNSLDNICWSIGGDAMDMCQLIMREIVLVSMSLLGESWTVRSLRMRWDGLRMDLRLCGIKNEAPSCRN